MAVLVDAVVVLVKFHAEYAGEKGPFIWSLENTGVAFGAIISFFLGIWYAFGIVFWEDGQKKPLVSKSSHRFYALTIAVVTSLCSYPVAQWAQYFYWINSLEDSEAHGQYMDTSLAFGLLCIHLAVVAVVAVYLLANSLIQKSEKNK